MNRPDYLLEYSRNNECFSTHQNKALVFFPVIKMTKTGHFTALDHPNRPQITNDSSQVVGRAPLSINQIFRFKKDNDDIATGINPDGTKCHVVGMNCQEAAWLLCINKSHNLSYWRTIISTNERNADFANTGSEERGS